MAYSMGSQNNPVAEGYGNTLRHRSMAANQGERLLLVYATLVNQLMQAQGYMERHMWAAKGETVGRCLDIFTCLQSSLDHDRGGAIAGNLDELYRYCMLRLLQASRSNDPAIIAEIVTLVKTLKSAWDEIV
ncbi:flagellar export chaperone FliS [Kistimonas scapharcae]|uniref:Flagellar secretion chaperone FliS n=1 Tax=Kistimonas scapharcae TaxID=1036133 RepID=A0ABP8V7D8_9GAMM